MQINNWQKNWKSLYLYCRGGKQTNVVGFLDGNKKSKEKSMDEIMGTLDTLTVEQLTEIKDRCAEIIKARKEAALAASKATKATTEAQRIAQAKAKIVVGSTIEFTMKGQNRTGVVEKVTEKTATVTLDEGKRYIQFKFIYNVVNAETAVEAAEAEQETVETATEEQAIAWASQKEVPWDTFPKSNEGSS